MVKIINQTILYMICYFTGPSNLIATKLNKIVVIALESSVTISDNPFVALLAPFFKQLEQ
ncbi:MAG: hypothetical protein ACI8WT_002363 [Clostridium sp.]|jgi:hypothetical protein